MRGRVQLILKFLGLVFLVSLIVVIWKALPIINGYAAKVACSGIFVAGRQPDRVLRDDLSSFPANLASCSINYQDSSVTASILGLGSRKAVYRWRLGATLLNGMTEEALREQHVIRPLVPALNPDTIDWPNGDRLRPLEWSASLRSSGRVDDSGGMGDSGGVGDSGGMGRDVAMRMNGSADGNSNFDSVKLRAAIGAAFGDGGVAVTGTRAVVVVWHGQVVAERYADGFDRHTRLVGWSMSKGVTNALAGILVKEGKLNTGAPAPIPIWSGDDRRLITVADLMHMNSGLRWWEFYGGPSDATDMLFKEANMGEYAANSSLRHSPGQVFNYSSGTANILSLILRKAIGDEYYYRFPYEQLFEKIGMYSAVLEPDASGTFVGSSYCYATARDWARFGLLYLHDGVWNGQRILPEGWVKWTTTGTSYGALWWLNKEESGARRHPQLPADCYACEGYEGQYVWVVPGSDLVVVRLAWEHGRKLNPDVFLPAVIKAL
jgi:CubicO group peptidase (beta-lactamase class C family)